MSPISRRKFLNLAGALSATAAITSILPGSACAYPMGLPIGIQLYTVGESLQDDAPSTLTTLREIGYREVETAGFGTHSAKEFRALLDAAGLTCPSAHLPLLAEDISVPLADANALGAHYATSSVLRPISFVAANNPKSALHSGSTPKLPPLLPLGLDGFKRMADRMNSVGRKTREAGLQYSYHNHNFEFEKLPDGSFGYDLLVKETDANLVKFEIDCGWMVVAGANPVDYFVRYPGRFCMLHIKDFKPVKNPTTDLIGSNRPQGTELGAGYINYAPIFAAGKAAGIEHVFAEEEAPFPTTQLEAAKVNYEFLHKFN